MSVANQSEVRPSMLDEIRVEAATFWREMPDKGMFFALLAVWLALFHFLGNSVFGYIKTSSLLHWMYHIYSTSPDDGHGMLVPLVVLGLLYWKRKELIAVPKQVWWPALALVAAALVIHMAGYLFQFPQVSIVAFYAGIYALTGVVWGWKWLLASFFPMVLFAFAVPLGTFGEAITFPMRLLAAKITAGVCSFVLGIDVIRKGTQLMEPSGRFFYEVAAACGGIRSLTSMLGLSTAYAFLSFGTNWRRTLIVLSAFPLAIAGNVFRLVCIVVAAEAFGQEAGQFVHDNFLLSLLPYVPAIVGLIVLGYWLGEKTAKPIPQQMEAHAT